MVQYICRKKARFGGEQYYAGNVVPAEKIDPTRIKQLTDYGVLSMVETPEPTVETPKHANQPESADEQQENRSKQSESVDKPDAENSDAEKSDVEKPDAEKLVGKRGKK